MLASFFSMHILSVLVCVCLLQSGINFLQSSSTGQCFCGVWSCRMPWAMDCVNSRLTNPSPSFLLSSSIHFFSYSLWTSQQLLTHIFRLSVSTPEIDQRPLQKKSTSMAEAFFQFRCMCVCVSVQYYSAYNNGTRQGQYLSHKYYKILHSGWRTKWHVDMEFWMQSVAE